MTKPTWPCLDCATECFGTGKYNYMVRRDIWECFGDEGFLCIGCLEERVGRPLHQDDLTTAPLNQVPTTDPAINRVRNTHNEGRIPMPRDRDIGDLIRELQEEFSYMVMDWAVNRGLSANLLSALLAASATDLHYVTICEDELEKGGLHDE